MATIPSSASAASTCRAARSSASPSPVRCWSNPRCCSSTTARVLSTSRRRRVSRRHSRSGRGSRRASSSRSASAACSAPTRSWCLTTAASPPRARTPSWWKPARSIARSTNPKWSTEQLHMVQHNGTRTDTTTQAPPPILGRGPGGPGRFMGEIARAKNTRGTVRRIWGYLRRQRAALIATALMVVVTSGLNVLGPYLMGRAIDTYILRHDLVGLRSLLLLMAVVYVLTSLLTWLQSYVMASAAQRTVRDIRNDLFARLQVLPLRFFDQRAHGDLMSRLTNDIENVNVVLSDGVTQLVSGVLSLVLNRWVIPKTREGFRQQQAALGALNGLIEETIDGQRVVKAYRREAA